MKSPAKDCPRFNSCSANNCPLDQSYPKITTDPNDREVACPMEKGVRVRISTKHPGVLKLSGLTTREWAAKVRYDSLEPAVKLKMAEAGRERLKTLHRSKTT
jgi:hypothetical protein